MYNRDSIVMEKVRKAASSEFLREEERAVLSVLLAKFEEGKGVKLTQKDIAKSRRWIGCHPKYEEDIVADRLETTTRQVRQVIRDLRIIHKLPILSDRKGYWICLDRAQASEYVQRIESEARAQSASWLETYATMKETLGTRSPYFDRMLSR